MTPAELQAWRARAGYTQEELAKWLGMNAMTISKYERGVLPIKPLVQWALFGLMTDQANHVSRDIAERLREHGELAKPKG